MNITKVTVKKIEGQQTLRGVASVVLDDEIKIRDIKILERGENGLSIMMPNKKVSEGNYWCSRAEVVGEYLGEYASEQISKGGELRLYDCESDEVYTLTLDKFLRGLATYISSCCGFVVENGCLDPGAIDAEGADCIVQYALFGDVIYG